MTSENPRDQVRFVTTPRRGELMQLLAPKYGIILEVIPEGELFVSGCGFSFIVKKGIGVGFVLPNIVIFRSFENEVSQLEKKSTNDLKPI